MPDTALTYGQCVDWLGHAGYGRDTSLDTVTINDDNHGPAMLALSAFRHPETAEVAYIFADDPFESPRVWMPDHDAQILHATATDEPEAGE